MATMSVMSIVSDSMKAKVYDARSAYMSCMRDKGLITALVGGGLLGAGMTVAGTVSISLIWDIINLQTHRTGYIIKYLYEKYHNLCW